MYDDPVSNGPFGIDKATAAIGLVGAITLTGGSSGTSAVSATGLLTTGFTFSLEALEHIVYRHWATSDAKGAGKFSPGTTARDLRNRIDEAVHKGRPTPDRFNRQRFDYDLGRTIGKTSKGIPTSKIRVILDAAGNVVTAFPIR